MALVIGNDRYPNLPATEQLQKAVNDARAVGDALGRLGFEVIRGENLGRQALVDKLDELTRTLSPGDTAFFFFAGHGVAISGGNFILPADVPNIESGQETRLARAALGESDIVADLQARGVRVAIVVLDACRNNPFKRPGVRSVGGERGFVRSDPVRGVFSLYSAGVGQTALDRLSDSDNQSELRVHPRAGAEPRSAKACISATSSSTCVKRWRNSPRASGASSVRPITTRPSAARSTLPVRRRPRPRPSRNLRRLHGKFPRRKRKLLWCSATRIIATYPSCLASITAWPTLATL